MELENNNNKLNVENTDTIDGLAYEQETSSLILLLGRWNGLVRYESTFIVVAGETQ